MFEKNTSYLYVANVARGTDTIADMADGSIAILNEAGTVLTGATTTGNARVAQKLSTGEVIYSPFFDMAKRSNVAGTEYVVPTQQVSYLGYNGASGSLDVSAAADYVLHLEWTNTAGIYNNSPLLIPGIYHTTDASQTELAIGLLNSLNGAMTRQPYEFVKTERVNSATVTADNDLLGDATVVNGAKAFTIAESTDSAADAGEYATSTKIVVGDFIRIGGVGAGTALTSAIYRVTAVSGISSATAIITVDSSIKSASGTYAAATSDIEVIPSATAIAADFGLKFTGVENSTFDAVNDEWSLTRFKIISGDFSTNDITYSTGANEGSGYYKKIANMEIYSQFLDKSPFISARPRNNYREETLSTKTYDFISFDLVDTVSTSIGGITYSKQFRIQIAMDVALTGDDVDTVFGVSV